MKPTAEGKVRCESCDLTVSAAQAKAEWILHPEGAEGKRHAKGSTLAVDGNGIPWMWSAGKVLVTDPLGGYEFEVGEPFRALDTYREALSLRPDWAGVLIELAWMHSTSSDPRVRNADQALRCATRANDLTGGGYPKALDALAAAYSEAGRFEEAAKTAERALAASTSPASKSAIRQRISLYRTGRPYREAQPEHSL
jgi:tetratricopeptide (TPR) repeat protein